MRYDAGSRNVTQKMSVSVNTYGYSDGIDNAVVLHVGDTDSFYALVKDHLGSVVAILNSAGNLVESYDYTPFGKTTIRNASGTPISQSTVDNILGFTCGFSQTPSVLLPRPLVLP